MGRSAREKRPPALPKVERVELNEKHMGLRFAAFALCLALGLTALGFGFYGLLSAEPGWARIEATSKEASAAGDFDFQYLLGEDATAQRKVLTTVYTQQCMELGKLFDCMQAYEDCPYNLSYINTHPGEDIQVDPRLYQALERLENAGDRTVYLGILNAYYLNLYYVDEDIQAGLDPFEDPDTSETFRQMADFAQSSAEVKLLGDNTLRLELNPEYEEFAGELGLDCYLDFGWLRNAFILDYIAGELSGRGFTQGVIASFDGFTRSLGGDVGAVQLGVYQWNGTRAVETGKQELDTPVNAAALNGFPMSGDDGRAYVYQSVLLGAPANAGAETVMLCSGTEDCVGLALELKDSILK